MVQLINQVGLIIFLAITVLAYLRLGILGGGSRVLLALLAGYLGTIAIVWLIELIIAHLGFIGVTTGTTAWLIMSVRRRRQIIRRLSLLN